MSKLLKPIIAAFIIGALAFVVFPQWVAWALPNAGHTRLSTSTSVGSGPPDIAHSEDINETYTAIVWAEGPDGAETLQLAYSQIDTTNRRWSYMTVDTNARTPSLAFDPIAPTVVHIVYQKGTGFAGIAYTKCTLGGSCSAPKTIATGDAINDIYNATPQIAVNTAGSPIIIYQRVQYSTSSRLYAAFVSSGGTGSVTTSAIGVGADWERNPTIARGSSNMMHVAYAADTDLNGSTDIIRYLRLNGADGSKDVTAASFSPKAPDDTEPDFPAIVAAGSQVRLVWQMKYIKNTPLGEFVMGYNTSGDNGSNWLANYRWILSNNSSFGSGSPDEALDVRLNSNNSTFDIVGGLRPDVTLSAGGRMHVVWQEQTPTRLDILYSYTYSDYSSTDPWRGTPILTLTTPISYTNVTTVYGVSEYNNKDGLHDGGAFDKARAKVVFGRPGNRAQIVYLSRISGSSSYQVMYNGWQEGDLSSSNPILQVKDSDCDTLPDTLELYDVPSCATGGYQYNGNYAYNCNLNKDDVPDFMDVNSDGDYLPDDVDTEWRVYNDNPGPFFPIILKNR